MQEDRRLISEYRTYRSREETLPRGTKLHNTYQIRTVLSSSALSAVYLARKIDTREKVIVKELFPTSLAARGQDRKTVVCRQRTLAHKLDEFREQFLQEAFILEGLDHPGIVRYLDHFEERGTAYLVMEFCEGTTLAQILEQREADLQLMYDTLLPVMNALAYLHAHGIIHRDIKPSNMMISSQGEVKLIDFGSAVQYTQEEYPIFTTSGYSPLEFYSKKSQQGPASDIYSLAAVMYRCCTGETPPDVRQRLFEDRLRFEPVGHGVSALLSTAIRRGLALRPQQRRISLGWLKAALRTEYLMNKRKLRRSSAR